MQAKRKVELVADITENFELVFPILRALKNRLMEIGAGKRAIISIKEWKKPRSNPLNAYLWAAVYPNIIRYIKDTTGQDFTSEQLHERYKKKYLGYEICEIPGMDDLVKLRSSTELDSQEFWNDFIEFICREWAELGLYIPLPEKKKG
jgi:hypothetical protein